MFEMTDLTPTSDDVVVSSPLPSFHHTDTAAATHSLAELQPVFHFASSGFPCLGCGSIEIAEPLWARASEV